MGFGKKKGTFAGQRRRRPGIWNHRLLLGGALAAAAALFLLGQFGETGVASWWKVRAERDELRREVADLEDGARRLETRLDELANDPEALEKLAREKNNMRREDEEVLTVLDRTGEAEKDDR